MSRLFWIVCSIQRYAFPRDLGPRKCATCWLLAGYLLATRGIVVAGRDPKKVAVAAAGSTLALHGRTWAPLEPSWGQLGPAWGQLGTNLN